MRTTVTLDPDVEHLLREFMHRHRTSFKAALNEAVRRGMTGCGPVESPPYRVEASDLGLRPGIDPAQLDDLADELEVEAFRRTTRELKARLDS